MSRSCLAACLWGAIFFWATAILWLSSHSPSDLPEAAFVFSDKINHFVAFAVGGWLAASALRSQRPGSPAQGCIVLAIALVSVFGAIDEGLQTFTPGRSGGDLLDWIADFLGAIAGALLSLKTHVRLERLLARP